KSWVAGWAAGPSCPANCCAAGAGRTAGAPCRWCPLQGQFGWLGPSVGFGSPRPDGVPSSAVWQCGQPFARTWRWATASVLEGAAAAVGWKAQQHALGARTATRTYQAVTAYRSIPELYL